jgi:hypothetical protein
MGFALYPSLMAFRPIPVAMSLLTGNTTGADPLAIYFPYCGSQLSPGPSLSHLAIAVCRMPTGESMRAQATDPRLL